VAKSAPYKKIKQKKMPFHSAICFLGIVVVVILALFAKCAFIKLFHTGTRPSAPCLFFYFLFWGLPLPFVHLLSHCQQVVLYSLANSQPAVASAAKTVISQRPQSVSFFGPSVRLFQPV